MMSQSKMYGHKIPGKSVGRDQLGDPFVDRWRTIRILKKQGVTILSGLVWPVRR